MKDYPTRWQRKMMWAALTACFVVVLVVVAAAVTAIFIAIQNPGRPSLRAADCEKLCWITSDDSNCVDLCLGFDHWWSYWSAPCCAAYCHTESAFWALRLEPAFA